MLKNCFHKDRAQLFEQRKNNHAQLLNIYQIYNILKIFSRYPQPATNGQKETIKNNLKNNLLNQGGIFLLCRIYKILVICFIFFSCEKNECISTDKNMSNNIFNEVDFNNNHGLIDGNSVLYVNNKVIPKSSSLQFCFSYKSNDTIFIYFNILSYTYKLTVVDGCYDGALFSPLDDIFLHSGMNFNYNLHPKVLRNSFILKDIKNEVSDTLQGYIEIQTNWFKEEEDSIKMYYEGYFSMKILPKDTANKYYLRFQKF